MTRRVLDEMDKRALRKLDPDVVIHPDGERAVISADIEVGIVRLVHDGGDLFELRLRFPNNGQLDVRIQRAPLLEQLDIKVAGDS